MLFVCTYMGNGVNSYTVLINNLRTLQCCVVLAYVVLLIDFQAV